MVGLHACTVGETCYSMPNLSFRDSPTFPGGGSERAGIGRATGRAMAGEEEDTVGSVCCATNWRIHSCCSGVKGGGTVVSVGVSPSASDERGGELPDAIANRLQ